VETVRSLFEQLVIRPDLILVNTISFLILLWLLKRFLFKPITNVLDTRAEEITGSYKAAENEKATMERLRVEYEAKIADIAAEAREKIAAAINEGQAAKQQILAEARAKSEEILKRGGEELSRERDKAIIELRAQVVDLAIEAAAKATARTLDDEAQRRLVRQFIEGVGSEK